MTHGKRDRGLATAPYFDLDRAAWIPCVTWWDRATGELGRVEGPHGFATWNAAAEASRFLAPRPGRP